MGQVGDLNIEYTIIDCIFVIFHSYLVTCFHMARNWVVVIISLYRNVLITGSRPNLCSSMFHNPRAFRVLSVAGMAILCLCAVPKFFEQYVLIEPPCEDYYQAKSLSLNASLGNPNPEQQEVFIVYGLVIAKEFESLGYLKILTHGVISFCIQSGGPILAIILSNVMIYLRIWKYGAEMRAQNASEAEAMHRVKGVGGIIFLVPAGFALLELPAFLSKILLFWVDGPANYWLQLLNAVGRLLTICDSIFNFFVYLSANPEYRIAIAATSACAMQADRRASYDFTSIRATHAMTAMRMTLGSDSHCGIEMSTCRQQSTESQFISFQPPEAANPTSINTHPANSQK